MTDLVPAPDPMLMEKVRFEVELRRLVDEALAKKKEKKDDGFFKHPVVLLVLGFLLTGGVGSFLTSCWQKQEWREQERHRAAEQVKKERLDTINYTTETIAAAMASGEDVLHLFSWTWRDKSDVVTVKERAEYWRDQSRKWRTAEKVLLARVNANFKDPEIKRRLDKIIAERYDLGNAITNLLWYADRDRMKFSAKTNDEVEKHQKLAQKLVVAVAVGDPEKHIDSELQELTRLMLEATNAQQP